MVILFLGACAWVFFPSELVMSLGRNAVAAFRAVVSKDDAAKPDDDPAPPPGPAPAAGEDLDAEIARVEKLARLREAQHDAELIQLEQRRQRDKELDLQNTARARVRAVGDLANEGLDNLSALEREQRQWAARVASLRDDEDGRRLASRAADVLAYLRLTEGVAGAPDVGAIRGRIEAIAREVEAGRKASDTFAPSPALDDQLRRERDEAERLLSELRARRARLEGLVAAAEPAPPTAGPTLGGAIEREKMGRAEEEREAAAREREEWRGAMLRTVAEAERKRGEEKQKALKVLLNSVWTTHWDFVHPKTRKIEELDDPEYREWRDIKAKYPENVGLLDFAWAAIAEENEDVLQGWLINNGIMTWDDFGTERAQKWCQAYRRDIRLLLTHYPHAFITRKEFRQYTGKDAVSLDVKRRDFEDARRKARGRN